VSELVARLERELGERVRTDKETLARHRHDSWVLSELLDLQGSPARDPLAVIEPETTAQVSAALQLCREAQVPIVPFGGGSGVCGAIRLGEEAVVLSTRGLDGLVELDADCLLAAFRAGTLGMAAEERVQQAGLTIGNWPQSIELSTVGGWVATRASGQFSTAYGSTEDLVLALEAVLPDGSVLRTRRTPRASVGPDLRQLFLGSEGTLGVITEVAFSLHPLPEASRPQAFHFAAFRDGLEAIRQLMRAGWRRTRGPRPWSQPRPRVLPSSVGRLAASLGTPRRWTTGSRYATASPAFGSCSSAESSPTRSRSPPPGTGSASSTRASRARCLQCRT
jgi:alkyldihydroxyacetonephosphate synthase